MNSELLETETLLTTCPWVRYDSVNYVNIYHFLAVSIVLEEELEYLPNEYSALSTDFVTYPLRCPEALLELRRSQIRTLPYGRLYFAPNPSQTHTKIMKKTIELSTFQKGSKFTLKRFNCDSITEILFITGCSDSKTPSTL